MRILLVCATETELAPVRLQLPSSVDVLVTGIGMVPMAARCARALARQTYDLVLNIGVCGSFDPALALGTVVHVVNDCIAELGAEDGESLLTMSEIGLAAESVFVNAAPPENPALRDFPRVDAITVNTAHGHGRSIAAVVARLHRHASLTFVRRHAQEMSEDVIHRHIDTYVSEFSIDLGDEGRRAVRLLFDRAAAGGMISPLRSRLFVS